MRTTRKENLITWAIICGIIAGVLAMLLGGCKTLKLKHEAAKFEKVMARVKSDSISEQVESVHTSTVTVWSDEQTINCDSVVRAAWDEAAVTLIPLHGTPSTLTATQYRDRTVVKWKTPIETFIFDTVKVAKNHYIENTAKVQLLQKQLAAADNSGGKMRWKRNMWRGVALVFIAVLLIDLIFRKSKSVNVRV